MQIVVGAAIVHAGRVLAARRSAPPAVAGGWEFPGGKVEPGESPEDALARECREELGVTVGVGARLGTADIQPGFELHVYAAALIAGTPWPLQDHDELRWLTAAELDDVPWLAADRPVLPTLLRLL